MTAYLDSSVLLRIVLRQRDRLAESSLVEVECLRTLDRMRLAQQLSDAELAPRREAVFRLVETLDVVELTRRVLGRAGQPMPTGLGTLDALHLATALLWRDEAGIPLVMATHDDNLALAARASGLSVLGV